MANTMFSRRHYEAIAEILSEQLANSRVKNGQDLLEILRDRFADLFEADNPLDGKGRGFKREKFEEACER